MPYTLQTDVEISAGGNVRLVELCDHDGDGLLDTAVLTAAQTQADGWIDSYLRRILAGSGFSLPLNPAPDIIKRVAAEQAVHVLKSWRGVLTEDDQTALELRQTMMSNIDRGILGPVPDERVPAGAGGPGTFERDTNEPVSREKLKGFW